MQASLSERVVVDGHGCHTALHFGVKAEKTKTKVLLCTGYLNSIKTYKERFIAYSSSCTSTELSEVLTSCLTAVRNVTLSTVKRYMKDLESFGLAHKIETFKESFFYRFKNSTRS